MLTIKGTEEPIRNDDKGFTRLKYNLSNSENGNTLEIRTNLYNNGHTDSYVYTFKKRFIKDEVEEYLKCSIEQWKSLLYTL